jgi:hypothetical protein
MRLLVHWSRPKCRVSALQGGEILRRTFHSHLYVFSGSELIMTEDEWLLKVHDITRLMHGLRFRSEIPTCASVSDPKNSVHHPL